MGRGRWRPLPLVLFVAIPLTIASAIWGHAVYELWLLDWQYSSADWVDGGKIHRYSQVHRRGWYRHGASEEWYETGTMKSWARYDRNRRIESASWSPEGELDGWWVPQGGVIVQWWTRLSDGGHHREQQILREGNTVVELRVADLRYAKLIGPETKEGFLSAEEIIAIVEDACAAAGVPIPEPPPIRAPTNAPIPPES